MDLQSVGGRNQTSPVFIYNAFSLGLVLFISS